MKTLILALAVLSSCDKLYSSDSPKPPEVINCLIDYVPEEPALMSKRIDAFLEIVDVAHEPDRPPEMRITMNDEVVVDACANEIAPGIYPYSSSTYVGLNFNLEQNPSWKYDYFANGEVPIRHEISIRFESRMKCGEGEWSTLVEKASTEIEWKKAEQTCLPPGYYGRVIGLSGS